jgi:hypothetical protein
VANVQGLERQREAVAAGSGRQPEAAAMELHPCMSAGSWIHERSARRRRAPERSGGTRSCDSPGARKVKILRLPRLLYQEAYVPNSCLLRGDGQLGGFGVADGRKERLGRGIPKV